MIAILFLTAVLMTTQPQAPHWGSLPGDTVASLKAEGIHQEQYSRLVAGDVLTEERSLPTGKTGVHMASLGIVHSSLDGLWNAIQDCGQRPDFTPHVKSCGLVKPDHPLLPNQEWEELKLSFRILLFNTNTELVNETTMEAPNYLSWKQVRGPAKVNEGYYRIITITPHHQLLVFDELVDPGPVPHFVKTWIVRNSLPGVVTGLRHWVERPKSWHASLSRDLS
jgi:hypothetical protein